MSNCCAVDGPLVSSETLELLKHGYVPCVYVQLYCPTCGGVRMATAIPPDDEWCDCPACGREHCNCGALGIGYTKRTLPQFEILMSPVQWPADDPEPLPEPDELVVEALSAGHARKR